MKFDFKEFKSRIHAKFVDQLDQEEIDELLNIDDGYSKDTPISSGKRLLITSILLKGTKTNGEKIDFSQNLSSGINVWIADNFKGKSSVFKIIQLALTGNDKLKHDIKKWLSYILLNIKIGEKNYSIYLDMSSRVINSKLFGLKINSFSEIETIKSIPLIDVVGLASYEKAIEDFFFKQFSYYSLKWTQKDSRKDQNLLHEASASWKTYFKSMFLESKDSNVLYGGQERKTFEMLMGLELTYPINRLTVRQDFLKFENAKRISLEKEREKLSTNQIEQLEAMRLALESQITQFDSKMNNEEIDLSNIYQQYNSILDEINLENSKYISIQDQLRSRKEDSYEIRTQIDILQHESVKLKKERLKTIKKISDIQEYIDVGAFFSNLDIKFCPSCDKEVPNSIKSVEIDSGLECNLCHGSISENDIVLDQEIYLSQIEENKKIQANLELEEEKNRTKILGLNEYLDKEIRSIEELERKLSQMPSLMPLKGQLRELEAIINSERQKLGSIDQEKYRLISEKAVVEFQLNQSLQNKKHVANDNYEKRILLLKFAVSLLKEARHSIGSKVIESFKSLMLGQLSEFGLSSITDIEISESFDVRYKQDGAFVSFDNIAEGEQLRAKIAFYLSLIQLDIEYNFGKHTRFLIIDSPSKEEGDHRYLEGLSTVLKIIENKFAGDLQILIGTAERNLSNVVEHETIVSEDDFLF